MSAWIVSKSHVDALVSLALFGPRDGEDSWMFDRHEFTYAHRGKTRKLTPMNADEVGRMLWRENYRSVNHRYGERSRTPAYSFERPNVVPTAVEGIKQAHCYEYQSCEHDGWKRSEALSFVQALADLLTHTLPGYDAAPWGWEDEHARSPV